VVGVVVSLTFVFPFLKVLSDAFLAVCYRSVLFPFLMCYLTSYFLDLSVFNLRALRSLLRVRVFDSRFFSRVSLACCDRVTGILS
jgi:hypothetical protein